MGLGWNTVVLIRLHLCGGRKGPSVETYALALTLPPAHCLADLGQVSNLPGSQDLPT